jgi:hypothetical protein
MKLNHVPTSSAISSVVEHWDFETGGPRFESRWWQFSLLQEMSALSHIIDVSSARPFNYMFFTPLYGVRNTGCPQISTSNKTKQIFFLDVIDHLEAFSAPQNAKFCS